MIINTDNPSEFPADDKIIVPDQHDRPLELRLNYVYAQTTSPLSCLTETCSRDRKGSSVKVQIYSPFIIINKTGLPFSIRSTTKMSISPKDVAGDTAAGTISEKSALLQL
jgi:vacuolar protein sorting-associated protein 13A/C